MFLKKKLITVVKQSSSLYPCCPNFLGGTSLWQPTRVLRPSYGPVNFNQVTCGHDSIKHVFLGHKNQLCSLSLNR